MTVYVSSLLGQTEEESKVISLMEDWGKKRVHRETSKSDWFL